MLLHPGIDPVAIDLGPISVRWYGLMYVLGFAAAWLLGRWRARRPWSVVDPREMEDLVWYLVLGLMIGARVGYMLFYDLPGLLADPLSMFAVWRGGMSFHGGLLGVVAAMLFFAWRREKPFFGLTDFICPLAPIGLGLGRVGNFINAELWGRPTDMPWGVIFPDPRAGMVPRHPSQLYEAFLEGLLLFAVLWAYSAKPRARGTVSGLFLLLYGCFRFLVEFFRTPDPQLGFLAFGWLTMGQLLSTPMILGGVALIWWGLRRAAGHRGEG
ncbi:prolipoprotein diacylglyceryl transferase [Desulfohalovibrio reitneri]|uniref:prolipoprotein diacylglyceryl transferase n=1 Tax=Desulfohalovibrio reitneri TaxID=1307759 RepID=UPI0004A74203|nr:prolipoprotein diacylglyceryl transferase [Desulfohalovibrio reitneri]